MGSILCQGQGKAGAASAVFLDGAENLLDAQPISPPANSAPALFNSLRREGFVWVFPSPMVVFSFPSGPKGLDCQFRFLGRFSGLLISSAHFPGHGPYDGTPRKSRCSSSHAGDVSRHGSTGKWMRTCAAPDGRGRRPCRCACFGSPPAHSRHPDDMRHNRLTAR